MSRPREGGQSKGSLAVKLQATLGCPLRGGRQSKAITSLPAEAHTASPLPKGPRPKGASPQSKGGRKPSAQQRLGDSLAWPSRGHFSRADSNVADADRSKESQAD